MLARLIVNALALAAAIFIVPGINLAGTSWTDKVVPLLIIAALFGVVNSVIKPITKVVSFPVIILTLGLFLWAINAAMLMLTSWIARKVGVGFSVTGWGSAFLGALIIAIVGALMSGFTRRQDDRRR